MKNNELVKNDLRIYSDISVCCEDKTLSACFEIQNHAILKLGIKAFDDCSNVKLYVEYTPSTNTLKIKCRLCNVDYCDYMPTKNETDLIKSMFEEFCYISFNCNAEKYIDSNMNSLEPVSREEIITYLRSQGYPYPDDIDIEWFLNNGEHQYQFNECVKNNYDLTDMERWQGLQKLFKTDIKFKTAMKIDNALWEEDIETLEIID